MTFVLSLHFFAVFYGVLFFHLRGLIKRLLLLHAISIYVCLGELIGLFILYFFIFYFIIVIMKTGGWFYKDRLGRSRGPMELIQLKTAWGAGIIDKHTFIWGDDMDEWAPIGMVHGLERAIATWEGSCFLLKQ